MNLRKTIAGVLIGGVLVTGSSAAFADYRENGGNMAVPISAQTEYKLPYINKDKVLELIRNLVDLYNQMDPSNPIKVVEDNDGAEKLVSMKGIVQEIIRSGEQVSLNIAGDKKNGYENIILHISKDTKIEDRSGNAVSINDLKTGAVLEAYYGRNLAKSLPPQGTAEKIVVLCADVTKLPYTTGKIKTVENNKGDIRVTLEGKGSNQGYDSVILNISKDTVITDDKGKFLTVKDLKAQTEVVGYYGPTATRSIPPISNAVKLVVKSNIEEYAVIESKISEVKDTKWGKQVLVGEKLENSVLLTVTGKTIIVDQKGKSVAAKHLKKGMKVKAYYGPVMTFSLPPQSAAHKIVILK